MKFNQTDIDILYYSNNIRAMTKINFNNISNFDNVVASTVKGRVEDLEKFGGFSDMMSIIIMRTMELHADIYTRKFYSSPDIDFNKIMALQNCKSKLFTLMHLIYFSL